MLKTPELSMNPKRKVKTKCHGEVREWNNREEAKDFFFEATMYSDGSEHDRYSAIYIQLIHGLSFCTDEED